MLAGAAATRNRVPRTARTNPAAPPPSARTMLSVTSWRMSRPRPAPSAVLTLARDAAHEQEVRDVRAGDQQDERHPAEQRQQRKPEAAGDPFLERHDDGAELVVVVGIVLG